MYIVVYSFVYTPSRIKLRFDNFKKIKIHAFHQSQLPTRMMCTMIYEKNVQGVLFLIYIKQLNVS